MSRISFAIASLGLVLGLTGAGPSHAAATNYHSYVSGTGSGSACTLTAPCFSFSGALGATVSGGEISCLDGPQSTTASSLIIKQTVTIDCPGVPAGQWFIIINGPGIVVTLRHLTVATFGVEVLASGIDFQNGAALFIENCVIENWNDSGVAGIHFAPSTGTAKLYVTDSVIKNNGNASGGGGIVIEPAAGAGAYVTIEGSKIENNQLGIFAGGMGSVRGVVRDSVVADNASSGIYAKGSRMTLLIENTAVTGNRTGLVATNNASMLVGHSSIAFNRTGLSTASGGTLSSYKNNDVNANIADGAFTTTMVQK
jgi:hypothetical protein